MTDPATCFGFVPHNELDLAAAVIFRLRINEYGFMRFVVVIDRPSGTTVAIAGGACRRGKLFVVSKSIVEGMPPAFAVNIKFAQSKCAISAQPRSIFRQGFVR